MAYVSRNKKCSMCGVPTVGKSRCKECNIKYMKEYYVENKSKFLVPKQKKPLLNERKRQQYKENEAMRIQARENAKRWKKENPQKALAQDLAIYGITIEDYEKMLFLQGGGCAICGSSTPNSKRAKRFSIDHCHKTGAVRGLLCMQCNMAVGLLGDDPELCNKAAEYLRKDL